MPSISLVTGVLVKNADNKFLLVKKPDDVGPYAGTYLPPGGAVDQDERIDEAALRELYEETGVKVTNLKRVYFDDDITENWAGKVKHMVGLLYTADYASGDLTPKEGNDDDFDVVGWFSLEEMKHMPLSPPIEKLMRHLGYL
ncbi:NUDIX hydrolase [Candidatus Saccharibacteria bacterium]|nr:NUDIX hydrolase [Candidatus Saccharibacteria bacterium]